MRKQRTNEQKQVHKSVRAFRDKVNKELVIKNRSKKLKRYNKRDDRY